MGRNIINELCANLHFYSNVECKIANIILSDPQAFIRYSMTEAAKAAGVSQGSLNNFARKIAGGGFSALKLQLAQQIPQNEAEEDFNLVKEGDSIKDILEKSRQNVSVAFRNTLDVNTEKVLQNVVEKILRAKRIEIYGLYQSGMVAQIFQYQLMMLGISAGYVSDVLMCPISASLLDKESLVIAISSTGKTKDIHDTVKAAQKKQVPVICMTGNASSPLAGLADDVLITSSSGKNVSNQMSEYRLSQLLLVDAICACLRYRIDEKGDKLYYRMNEFISAHSVDDF